MEALRSLLAVFKIGVDDKELEHAEKKIEGFTETLRKVGEAFVEAFALEKFGEFFKGTIEAGARLGDLSEKLGIGARELQQFQFAAGLAGVEGESAARALGFLNKNVGEALTGSSELAQSFGKLHVALKDTNGQARPVGDILADVADAVKDLPDQQTRAAYAMKLFGREGQSLLPMLADGREGLQALYAEFDELGGGLSNQFVKDAKKADDELRKIHLSIAGLKARVTASALPAIQKMIEWVKKGTIWFHEFGRHTDVIEHALKSLAVAGVLRLIVTLTKLAKTFGLLKPSIAQTLASLLKFGAPLLIIGALALAFEDLWTMMEGGDSVLGDLLVEMYGVEGAKQFVDDLSDSWDELKSLWEEIKPLGGELLKGAIEAIPVLMKLFLGLFEVVKSVYDTLKGIVGVVGTAAGRAGDLLGGGMSDEKVARLKAEGQWTSQDEIDNNLQRSRHQSALNAVDQEASKAGGNILKDFSVIGDLFSGNKADHLAEVPSGVTLPEITIQGGGAPAGGHTVHQNNEIHVNVQGGSDAKQTGQIVGQGVASKLEREKYNALAALKKP